MALTREHRSRLSRKTGQKTPLERDQARLQRRGRGEPAWQPAASTHSGPTRRRQTVGADPRRRQEGYVNCLGALTGGQAVQQAKAGIEAIYLSGWQVAADNNLSSTMYPDQSLYPATPSPPWWSASTTPSPGPTRSSGPTRLDRDKGFIDYFLPIVADAEAGFGGVLNAFD